MSILFLNATKKVLWSLTPPLVFDIFKKYVKNRGGGYGYQLAREQYISSMFRRYVPQNV